MLPKPWYVIISGPFEGVRFGKYDGEIRQDVERYANCRAYGPSASVTDEATATRRLREAREQRVRNAREHQQATTLTPAPVPNPRPASAPAKPTTAMAEAEQGDAKSPKGCLRTDAPPGPHLIQNIGNGCKKDTATH
eukprot:6033253-Pleurochrysis_carterae.AAC.2